MPLPSNQRFLSPFAPLHPLRIGCVRYLNARPLIEPYDGEVCFEHPARLADLLAAGEVDIALVPAFEALRRPDFPVVDGIAIASRGPVYSVFLAHRCPLPELRAVRLDPASRTSNNLVRCILSEFHGLSPLYEPQPAGPAAPPGPDQGLLLIGNQAIRFRESAPAGVQFLDLGGEWTARTGLPFVYALWQARPGVLDSTAADALRMVAHLGSKSIPRIAAGQTGFAPAFAEHYLTAHIAFGLGPDEKAGLARFEALLRKHRLLDAPPRPLRFL